MNIVAQKQVEHNQQIGKDIIYLTYTRHGYVYLTGRVDAIEYSEQWCGWTLKVYNYALKRHQRELANNVISEGALVEVLYEGERFAVEVLQIDFRLFEAEDDNGNTKWIMPTRITGVIENEWTHSKTAAAYMMQEAIA
jgi:hypothetical protein